MKQAEAWVDGSYNTRNGLAGYGVYLIVGSESLEMSGSVTKFDNSSRNVVGETTAAIIAVQEAIARGCTDVIIRYDYEGVEKWITGEWTCRKPISKQYRDKMYELMKRIGITFEHVKAHSGDENNNRADRLAKQGCGLR